MNILASTGSFKEYMLTGGFSLLSIFILLELTAPGDVSFYFNWLYCEFLPISQSIPGIFLSVVASSIILFAIVIGLLLELLGSFLFMVEVVVLQDEIKKDDDKSFGHLLPENTFSNIKEDIDYIKNYTDSKCIKDFIKNLFSLRKSHSNIEFFLVLCCSDKMNPTQNDLLLRKMSSIRIVRSLSHLYLILFIYYTCYILTRFCPELQALPTIIKVSLSVVLIIIVFFAVSFAPIMIRGRMNKTIALTILVVDTVILFSLCSHPNIDWEFLAVLLYVPILFLALWCMVKIAYHDYINTLLNMLIAQRHNGTT